MDEVLDFLTKYYKVISFIAIAIVIWVYTIKQQADENKRVYLAVRNEEISRISEGVAGGIVDVFKNQNFINAIHSGVSINIQINVDGSQNIIITGSNNKIDT